ncbi:MAG: aminotransferase class I/II-fold pyridoxal phosphate-dependent enzyme [Alphaproteobacteria bacterium]|nr:aminotransferase class I/II-fold pyridoxal phosphate-dependent enzyme [Alphaproteobacteria bacterium]HPF48043.1 aminotransferase class I/II-fold pyridoxal phosphate-dependent enzyme [Emcibacteraceae bacterium]HRW28402.1 aminotransferase class I/II-fold pyridoxal phosphate-dependent enzyme [Emcibacteraceae bacterium]
MRNFELEVFFSKWEFKAKYHLTASDMESMTMKELLAMASPEDREAFENLWLGYTQTYGLPALRCEIAKTYDHMKDQNILCFVGAEEGIYAAMRSILDKDDHAIVIVPNYQAAETIPISICDVTGIRLDADNDWDLNIDALVGALRPNTKLISINFPNNPTGKIISREKLESLVNIAREFDVYIFSDEVYRGIELDENKRLPQIADLYEKGLSLNVMSKAYGLPGLRIGWLASQDTAILAEIERYKHFLTICNSAPSEILSLIALKSRDNILKRNKKILSENLNKLDKFFGEFPNLFDWKRPDGGAVAYPRYLGPDTANEFCEKLLDETGILLLPPRIYNSELMSTPQDHFRIGFGRSGMDKMLDIFYHYLKKNRA